MQDILQRMLEWCRELRIPVVMLSATLATETKKKVLDVYRVDYKEEQEYPAITAVYENGDYQISPIPEVSKRRVISINTMAILHDLDAIRNCALKTVEGGGCLCILVNTVGRRPSGQRPPPPASYRRPRPIAPPEGVRRKAQLGSAERARVWRKLPCAPSLPGAAALP